MSSVPTPAGARTHGPLFLLRAQSSMEMQHVSLPGRLHCGFVSGDWKGLGLDLLTHEDNWHVVPPLMIQMLRAYKRHL